VLLGTRRLPPSIDISCPHGAQQQTHRTPLLWSNDGTNRQTDARPFHIPCSPDHAGSANNEMKILNLVVIIVY